MWNRRGEDSLLQDLVYNLPLSKQFHNSHRSSKINSMWQHLCTDAHPLLRSRIASSQTPTLSEAIRISRNDSSFALQCAFPSACMVDGSIAGLLLLSLGQNSRTYTEEWINNINIISNFAS